jgi:beta-lactamase class A
MKVLMPIVCLLMAADAPATDGLRRQLEEISRAAQGRVGAAATVLETGESVAVRGDEHFPMQSVYKLPIGMAVLHAVDGGALSLDRKIRIQAADLVPAGVHSPLRDRYPRGGVELSLRDLLGLMIEESDGTASDVLLRLAGGAESVTRFLRGLGIVDMVVATSEAEMARGEEVQYRNWASPAATIKLLRAIQEGQGLSTPSRALLREFMFASPTGPRRIKGLLPPDTRVAHKTGTSRTIGGLTRATNDAGIVRLPDAWHLAVVVFVADSKADEATREAVIARIARAAWDRWSRPRVTQLREPDASTGSDNAIGSQDADRCFIASNPLILDRRSCLRPGGLTLHRLQVTCIALSSSPWADVYTVARGRGLAAGDVRPAAPP